MLLLTLVGHLEVCGDPLADEALEVLHTVTQLQLLARGHAPPHQTIC